MISLLIKFDLTSTFTLPSTPGAFRVWSGDTTNSSTLFLECPGTATNGNPNSFPMHTGTVWVEALKGGSATFTAKFEGTGIASNYNVVRSFPMIAVVADQDGRDAAGEQDAARGFRCGGFFRLPPGIPKG